MYTYKLITPTPPKNESIAVLRSDGTSIPFDLGNTDFQTFRTSILDGLAQLENADGVLMTSQDAIAFVEGLPA